MNSEKRKVKNEVFVLPPTPEGRNELLGRIIYDPSKTFSHHAFLPSGVGGKNKSFTN